MEAIKSKQFSFTLVHFIKLADLAYMFLFCPAYDVDDKPLTGAPRRVFARKLTSNRRSALILSSRVNRILPNILTVDNNVCFTSLRITSMTFP